MKNHDRRLYRLFPGEAEEAIDTTHDTRHPEHVEIVTEGVASTWTLVELGVAGWARVGR